MKKRNAAKDQKGQGQDVVKNHVRPCPEETQRIAEEEEDYYYFAL